MERSVRGLICEKGHCRASSLLPPLAAEAVEGIVAGDAEAFQVEVLANEPRKQSALLVAAFAAVGVEAGELLVGEEDSHLIHRFLGHFTLQNSHCRTSTYLSD